MDHRSFITDNVLAACIVIGCSGAGKGTAIKGLRRLGIGFGYLETGEKFRRHELENPGYSKIISSYTSKGQHVPLENTLPLVTEWFGEITGHRLVVLDGFPRNIEQIEPAFSLLSSHGYMRISTIFIDTPAQQCAHRLIQQAREMEHSAVPRNDSDELAMAERLSTYAEKVLPVIDILEEKSNYFHRVDGGILDFRNPEVLFDIAIKAGLVKC